jgi:hypothetical protein
VKHDSKIGAWDKQLTSRQEPVEGADASQPALDGATVRLRRKEVPVPVAPGTCEFAGTECCSMPWQSALGQGILCLSSTIRHTVHGNIRITHTQKHRAVRPEGRGSSSQPGSQPKSRSRMQPLELESTSPVVGVQSGAPFMLRVQIMTGTLQSLRRVTPSAAEKHQGMHIKRMARRVDEPLNVIRHAEFH